MPAATGEGDVYLLSAILHGFDDETATRILRNLADAIGDTGASAALLELVLPETHADLSGASFDMQMLVNTRGRARTRTQWQSLVERSGLVLEEVVGLRSFGRILVLRHESQPAA